MSARRQRPPWYNCSKLGCVSFEARRQRESCRSTDAPSGISLSTALEDCGPASCVRKTADSLEPPRYCCKGNVLLMTWPSYCFQEKLMLHLKPRVRATGEWKIGRASCRERG